MEVGENMPYQIKILIVVLIFLFVFVTWAMCKVASDADDQSQEMYQNKIRKER